MSEIVLGAIIFWLIVLTWAFGEICNSVKLLLEEKLKDIDKELLK